MATETRSIDELVRCRQENAARLKELNNQLAEVKQEKAKLNDSILLYLASQGEAGSKGIILDCGTVRQRVTEHVSIDSLEAACRYMYKKMKKIAQIEEETGIKQSFADAMIFQKRAGKKLLLETAKEILDQLGRPASKENMKIVLLKLCGAKYCDKIGVSVPGVPDNEGEYDE